MEKWSHALKCGISQTSQECNVKCNSARTEDGSLYQNVSDEGCWKVGSGSILKEDLKGFAEGLVKKI